jgi:hypothetical protein
MSRLVDPAHHPENASASHKNWLEIHLRQIVTQCWCGTVTATLSEEQKERISYGNVASIGDSQARLAR